MSSRADLFDPREWDFRTLIPDCPTPAQHFEVVAATLHEYGRESETVRKLAAEAAPVLHVALVRSSPELAFFTCLRFWNCVFWPEYFPHAPWLKIPPAERTERIQNYPKDHSAGDPLRINGRDELEEAELPEPGGRIFLDSTLENLLVTIDWASYNDSEIIVKFARWVKQGGRRWRWNGLKARARNWG
jgi:hypothetical protein